MGLMQISITSGDFIEMKKNEEKKPGNKGKSGHFRKFQSINGGCECFFLFVHPLNTLNDQGYQITNHNLYSIFVYCIAPVAYIMERTSFTI